MTLGIQFNVTGTQQEIAEAIAAVLDKNPKPSDSTDTDAVWARKVLLSIIHDYRVLYRAKQARIAANVDEETIRDNTPRAIET
jgi:hypothetical protein